MQDGLWGFIDNTGKFILPPMYKDAQQFTNGQALVNKNNEFIFIDKKGKFVKKLENPEERERETEAEKHRE